MICYINTADFDDAFTTKLKKAEGKIFLMDRPERGGILSACGRVLLGYMLKNKYGIDSFSYRYGENGKPYLENEKIFFSISHSGDYVLCCLSDTEIGCDIEKIKDYKSKIAKRFFTEKEASLLESKADAERNFFLLWTLKESILKKDGTGIAGGLDTYCFADYAGKKSFRVYGCEFLSLGLGEYAASVCADTLPTEPVEIGKNEIEMYIDEINRKNT